MKIKELEKYTDELILRDGIYFSNKVSQISYPEGGNQDCFQLEENSFWFKHRNDCIVHCVKKYSPADLFFDIGGGNGYVAKSLEAALVPTVLVEPGIQGCLNARKRGLEHVICSTLEDCQFNASNLPSAGLFDVVEHIEDDTAFLEVIFNLLKPSGYLYITVPAFTRLWSNEDDDAGHFHRYTNGQLAEKLTAIGFEMVYQTYFFSILPVPIFLLRTVPSMLGFNRNSDDLEKQKKEHKNRTGLVEKMLNKVWKFELDRIAKGGTLPFGSSCLSVARKPG